MKQSRREYSSFVNRHSSFVIRQFFSGAAMTPESYIEDAILQFRKLKDLADKALAQVEDKDFLRALDAESNSIAAVVKHIAGNMRSRWTDFLTSDGEKPDRKRDTEFAISGGESR